MFVCMSCAGNQLCSGELMLSARCRKPDGCNFQMFSCCDLCACGSCTHLMYHQPSRFFWMTSTMTPFSKLTSSFPWLEYGCIVTYFSSEGKRVKRDQPHMRGETAVLPTPTQTH